MAGEVGASASPLGAQPSQAPRGPKARGNRPLPSDGRAHGMRYPVADRHEGRLMGPGGHPAVLAYLDGTPELGDLFPGGPWCAYQGVCVPDPGVDQPCLEEGSGEQPDQERRGEHSSPLAGPRDGRALGLQRWTRVAGIMGSQVEVR